MTQRAAMLMLLLATMIWGSSFVIVKKAVAAYPVYPFLTIRFLLACLALLPMMAEQGSARLRTVRRLMVGPNDTAASHRFHLGAGLVIGLFLFGGFATQTLGLQYTTPTKAGFITGLSVVIVPLLAGFVLREPPTRAAIGGAVLAAAGLALLALNPNDLTLQRGDALELLCAFLFAGHILAIARLSPRADPLRLTMVQLVVVTVCSGALALWGGAWRVGWPPASVLLAALFTGVFGTALAFGLQTSAQRYTRASYAALVLTAEPVFAALFSYLWTGERLGAQGWLGCGLIFVGIVAVEAWPSLRERERWPALLRRPKP